MLVIEAIERRGREERRNQGVGIEKGEDKGGNGNIREKSCTRFRDGQLSHARGIVRNFKPVINTGSNGIGQKGGGWETTNASNNKCNISPLTILCNIIYV